MRFESILMRFECNDLLIETKPDVCDVLISLYTNALERATSAPIGLRHMETVDHGVPL